MLKFTLSSLVASFPVAVELPHKQCLSDYNNGRPSLLGSCSLMARLSEASAASEEKCEWENGKTTVAVRLSAKTKTKEAVAAAALPAKMKGVGYCDWVQISLNLISISLKTF